MLEETHSNVHVNAPTTGSHRVPLVHELPHVPQFVSEFGMQPPCRGQHSRHASYGPGAVRSLHRKNVHVLMSQGGSSPHTHEPSTHAHPFDPHVWPHVPQFLES